MTLEEAQDKILELQDDLAKVTGERDTLSQDKDQLTNRVKDLEERNQRLFNRLPVSGAETDNDDGDDNDDEEEPETLEDYAHKLANLI